MPGQVDAVGARPAPDVEGAAGGQRGGPLDQLDQVEGWDVPLPDRQTQPVAGPVHEPVPPESVRRRVRSSHHSALRGLPDLAGYLNAQMAAGRLRRMDPVLAVQLLAGPILAHQLTRPLAESLVSSPVPAREA